MSLTAFNEDEFELIIHDVCVILARSNMRYYFRLQVIDMQL